MFRNHGEIQHVAIKCVGSKGLKQELVAIDFLTVSLKAGIGCLTVLA